MKAGTAVSLEVIYPQRGFSSFSINGPFDHRPRSSFEGVSFHPVISQTGFYTSLIWTHLTGITRTRGLKGQSVIPATMPLQDHSRQAPAKLSSLSQTTSPSLFKLSLASDFQESYFGFCCFHNYTSVLSARLDFLPELLALSLFSLLSTMQARNLCSRNTGGWVPECSSNTDKVLGVHPSSRKTNKTLRFRFMLSRPGPHTKSSLLAAFL